jgi:DNA-binding transcriptional LysR family regulator
MARSRGAGKASADRSGLQSARSEDRPLSRALLARVYQPALLYFGSTAERLSIRECACRLNVASSAVSRQISQLEDALGMSLFDKDGRRVRLTTAGEVLLRPVRRLVKPLEAAVSELDVLRGLKMGSVRIATVESVELSFLPPPVAEFGRRHPTLQLNVAVTSAREVVARLSDESVDIGFAFFTRPTPDIEMAVRRDVRIGVLTRPDHPLAKATFLTLSACLRHPVAVGRRVSTVPQRWTTSNSSWRSFGGDHSRGCKLVQSDEGDRQRSRKATIRIPASRGASDSWASSAGRRPSRSRFATFLDGDAGRSSTNGFGLQRAGSAFRRLVVVQLSPCLDIRASTVRGVSCLIGIVFLPLITL